jgi:hypothetical protein
MKMGQKLPAVLFGQGFAGLIGVSRMKSSDMANRHFSPVML